VQRREFGLSALFPSLTKLIDNKTKESLTRFAFRNPNGITYGYATFDLLLQNSSITKLCFVIPTERSDESRRFR